MAKRDRDVPLLAQVFRIMGDGTRLSILMELQEDEQNVTALVKRLKTPQSTVSHHLALLRMAGLVTSRRRGKEVFYCLNGGHVGTEKALKALLGESAALKVGSVVIALADK